MTKIFLDLDGVMADLEGYYLHRFGHAMDDAPSKKVMWDNINNDDDFFFHMWPMEGALEFFDRISHLNPVILTSCPTSRYGIVAQAKKAWVRKHLDDHMLIIPCMGSETKQFFVQQYGDILIDDYGKNCREWEYAGGIAVKHEGKDFDATLDKLLETLNESSPVLRRDRA